MVGGAGIGSFNNEKTPPRKKPIINGLTQLKKVSKFYLLL